jgi:hypothetical protein
MELTMHLPDRILTPEVSAALAGMQGHRLNIPNLRAFITDAEFDEADCLLLTRIRAAFANQTCFFLERAEQIADACLTSTDVREVMFRGLTATRAEMIDLNLNPTCGISHDFASFIVPRSGVAAMRFVRSVFEELEHDYRVILMRLIGGRDWGTHERPTAALRGDEDACAWSYGRDGVQKLLQDTPFLPLDVCRSRNCNHCELEITDSSMERIEDSFERATVPVGEGCRPSRMSRAMEALGVTLILRRVREAFRRVA